MKAKNKVVAGDYIDLPIIFAMGNASISLGLRKGSIDLSSEQVKSYELITNEHTKSASSGVARGLVGGVLLGPVGMLAGGLSAKNKGVYHVAVEFKNNKKSLLEVDDKIYKAIMTNCFNTTKFTNSTNHLGKADELEKLKKLLDDSVITQIEFDEQKSLILNSTNTSISISTSEYEIQSHEIINEQTTIVNSTKPKRKKGWGCLIPALILTALVLWFTHSNTPDSLDLPIYFNVIDYYSNADNGEFKPITEDELINKIGNPDNTEDWNYEVSETISHPLRTLTYNNGTREFTFSSGTGNLVRITLNEKIPYSNKENILALFNLEKSSYSVIKDTGVTYRVNDCIIDDFWITSMTEEEIESVKLTLTNDIFE